MFVGATLAMALLSHGADLFERLGLGKSKSTDSSVDGKIGGTLTQDQMVGGLKEALANGVEKAAVYGLSWDTRNPLPGGFQIFHLQVQRTCHLCEVSRCRATRIQPEYSWTSHSTWQRASTGLHGLSWHPFH